MNQHLNFDKTKRVLEVLQRHNVQPMNLSAWVGSIKNVVIQTATTLPDCRENPGDVECIKENMEASKAAYEFLTDLQVAMEE